MSEKTVPFANPHPQGSGNVADNALAQNLGITALSLTATEAKFAMPVQGNTQVAGWLHGGATAALCENAASAAANKHAESFGRVAVGTEISVAHLRSVKDGQVVATATSCHLGRRRTVHEVKVVDERGRLIATALVTNMIIEV